MNCRIIYSVNKKKNSAHMEKNKSLIVKNLRKFKLKNYKPKTRVSYLIAIYFVKWRWFGNESSRKKDIKINTEIKEVGTVPKKNENWVNRCLTAERKIIPLLYNE